MGMKLTKKELKLLRFIAEWPNMTITEISEATNTPLSYSSRAISRLERKGLATTNKRGNTKTVAFADTGHGILLRQQMLENSHMTLDSLANTGMRILATINCLNLLTWEEIQEYAGVSYYALRPKMNQFTEVGLVEKKKSYRIHPRFTTLREFLQAYQSYINNQTAKRLAKDAVVKWECCTKFLLETAKTLRLQATGTTAFVSYGALFITATNLYLYEKKTKDPLRLEDHLLNHVLAHRQTNITPYLVTWALNRNNIDKATIIRKARIHGVDNIIEATINYFDTKGKERSLYMPSWSELNSRVKEYQR
jgi:DNA-binding transcriptional regulator GbsR (MarR family)